MAKNRKPSVRNDASTKKRAANRKKITSTPREGIYNGILYESLTEYNVLSWLFELKDNGYIAKIERSESFLLSDSVTNNYVVQMKRGSKPMAQTLAHGHSYTADFNVLFNEKALGVFCWDIESKTKHEKEWLISHPAGNRKYLTYIEVKPDIDWRGKNAKAINDAKWVYQRHNKFINIFKIEDRFKTTFTPNSYLLTGTGKPRKIKYEVRSLEQYLNEK